MAASNINFSKVPLMRPRLPSADELIKFLRVIDQNQIYSNFGPINNLLQQTLACKNIEWFGTRPHIVTTSSGTSAIEILLQTLDLPKGSTIIIPALTFIATCTAVRRLGYRPLIADVERDSWLMTPNSLHSVSLDNVSAVIPVATFGAPQDAKKWSDWSHKTGIKVIIDAAAGVGSQSVAPNVPAAFSLHATKSLSAAEGGFIATLDATQASRVKKLTNFGLPDLGELAGTNAKLSEYHAAIALAAIETWDESVARRTVLVRKYLEALESPIASGDISVQSVTSRSPSVFLIRFKTRSSRDLCARNCANAGIETRVWYTPLMQNHPAVMGIQCASSLDNALFLEDRLLGLPFFLDLSPDDIGRVASQVINSVQSNMPRRSMRGILKKSAQHQRSAELNNRAHKAITRVPYNIEGVVDRLELNCTLPRNDIAHVRSVPEATSS